MQKEKIPFAKIRPDL